ncbi:unnamed protein product, partial [Mesorhabditis belari]|uniref:Uncharacterized protein n=1 Tax=Mesorhabditis belari TaxID=2138241 RepID=A0AAF3EIM2_9BILA
MIARLLENSKFWQKYRDLFYVIFITFGLLGFYVLLQYVNNQGWSLVYTVHPSDNANDTQDLTTNCTNEIWIDSSTNRTRNLMVNASNNDSCAHDTNGTDGNDWTDPLTNNTLNLTIIDPITVIVDNGTYAPDDTFYNEYFGEYDDYSSSDNVTNDLSNYTSSYDKLPADISFIIKNMTIVVMFLSFFTTPLAAYFAVTNDRLSWPIRLLACAENVNKFVQALGFLLSESCGLVLYFDWKPFRCTRRTAYSFIYLYIYLGIYGLSDIALYCQFLVSLSRFLVLSLDGAYFQYTTKLPVLQLITPYILRIALGQAVLLMSQNGEYIGNYAWIEFIYTYLIKVPSFLACGLDVVTNMRLRALKSHGSVSRCDSHLMIQMLSNSLLTITNQILYYLIAIIIYFFWGDGVMQIWDGLRDFNQALLFNLVGSLICLVFLRKPREHTPRRDLPATVVSMQPSTPRQTAR